MTLELAAPSRSVFDAARRWRNKPDVRPGLRTPFMLTIEQQGRFYDDVVCDRNSPHRYFTLLRKRDATIAGLGGLTNIEWENGHAEISLILAPHFQGQGCGKEAVLLLLEEAFDRMRLETVFGEVYACNDAVDFWVGMLSSPEHWTQLPNRKMHGGVLYNSLIFWFYKVDWKAGRYHPKQETEG